jgi:hypothetical protein
MIAAVILALHGAVGIYAFWTRKEKGRWSEGVLAVAFVGVIFSVGWTIMTMLTNVVLEPEGFAEWFNRDAVTLTLLTVAEGFFYYFFLRSGNAETGPSSGTPPVSGG